MEAAPALSAAHRQKSLGAFYTPAPMAEKMVEWAVGMAEERVLDPSFGGLAFLHAAHQRLVALGATPEEAGKQLYGVDLDHEAHALALADQGLNIEAETLLLRDFFETKPGQDLPLADAVVGNPPYVRYQLSNGAGDAGHRVADEAGMKLTRLASTWAPFVLHSTAFVASTGRMALVLPAELLHAQYADQVLSFVQERFKRTTIVMFERRVFPGALEEVVLLFGYGRTDRAGETHHLSVVSCDDLDDLSLASFQLRPRLPRTRSRDTPGADKLLAHLLPDETRDLYQGVSGSYSSGTRLGGLASVDIGVVTGANDYFLLRDGEEPRVPDELLRPAVSKAIHVGGARFDQCDTKKLADSGARYRLFVAHHGASKEELRGTGGYLRRGRERGIHKRYKCRVRDPWWSLPLPKHGVPKLFMTYCAAEHPRLVVNEAEALHTNTVHGVSPAPDVDREALAAGFYNSLTLLSAELVGRSYGGGVLKLEPTEAEALVVPPMPEGLGEQLGTVDRLLRSRDLDSVLDLIDRLVLIEGMGLSEKEVASLRSGAERLRSRRRGRSKAPR